MPEKKKATDMTTEELARRVFPPEVVEELKRMAKEPQRPPAKKPESRPRNKPKG